MSDMYAIKGTTLTALGDAVRSKVIGTTELPIITVEDQYVNYSRSYPFQLPDFVVKTRIIGTGFYGSNKFNNYGLQGLGFAPGRWGDYQDTDIRKSPNYIVINEGLPFNPNGYGDALASDYNFTFEFEIEDNKGAFVATQLNSSPKQGYISYTAIGLDKDGNEFKYTPLEMAEVINGLETIPTEAFIFTGSCSHKFANGSWDWFINQCGDKITTNNITDTVNMFNKTSLKTIPFDINIARNTTNIENTFNYADKLEVVPYIIGPEKNPPTSSYSGTLNMGYIFGNCQRLRYIPEDYFWKIVPNKDFWEVQANISSQGQDSIFGYCYSLRELPDISMIGGNWTSGYSCIYYNFLQFCYSLDKAINIPVYGTFSSNAMSNLFYNNHRLKEFMFLMNEDGTPKTANWKNQTIETTSTSKGTLGYGTYSPTNYNAGITPDKKVIDDATYQALKDDPDWYSFDVNYSRYNHDSAVNTINSLPDTSAYGTNTIKFKGEAGALTDGGAINTLTEEEIAVAIAKGWTVSLV